MQRPKWLSGWGEGKNLLEARLLIDLPDIMVVEASFDSKLLFFAIGTSQENETLVSGKESAKENESKFKTDLEWKIFYDKTALPRFMPIDKAKNLMAGIVSVSSGIMSVYNLSTIFVPSSSRPSKGNAPVLLDYEIARKIEEAKKNKSS